MTVSVSECGYREAQEQVEDAMIQIEHERTTIATRLQRAQGELARREVVC